MHSRYGMTNFAVVRDSAREWGMAQAGEARDVREQVGAERVGVTRYQLRAGRRAEPARRRPAAEELYVVLFGDGRVTLDGDELPLAAGDVVRVAAGCVAEFEAGAAGLELLATRALAAGGEERA